MAIKEDYIKRAPHNYFFGSLVDADGELDYLQDFAESTVKVLHHAARESKTKRRKLNLSLLAISGDVEYLYSVLYASDVHQAFIIACVIFLERDIRSFARGLKVALQLGLGLRDLSGSILERFRKYCEKVARLDLGLNDTDWQEIKGVIAIRNCLVHCSGNLDDFSRKSEIVEFAQRHGTPRIEEGWIRIEKETVNIVLKVLRVFVERTYESALERFPKENDQYMSSRK